MSNYIRVDVFTGRLGNASNNGISSNEGVQLVVPHPHGSIHEEDLEGNYTVLELKPCYSVGGPPFFQEFPAKGRSMFGGCFVYSSDSRYSELYGGYPLKLFDRFE